MNLSLRETIFRLKYSARIVKDIVALLNTNGGTILVGVDDDGKVIGINKDIRDELVEKVSSLISYSIKPDIRHKIKHYYDEDNVLHIDIKESTQKPCYILNKGIKPSGIYVRIGRSSRMATDEEIVKMIREYSSYSWEDEVNENQDLHFKYLSIYFEKANLHFDITKYRTLHLINNEGKFTNLALLLSDENPFEVKFSKYDEKLNFLFKKTYKDSIVLILDRILKQAEDFNDVSANILPDRPREEFQSYPEESLREAIVNSICHADYEFPSNIKIEFFTDYCKISNPGSVYKYTLEEVLKGVQSFRNPHLISVLNKLGFIENYGSGLRRILKSYENKNKEVKFENITNAFIVELPNLNPILSKESLTQESIVESERNIKLKTIDSKEEIIKLIKSGKNKNKDFMKHLNLSKSTIYRLTKEMSDEEIIVHIGENRNGFWIVKSHKYR